MVDALHKNLGEFVSIYLTVKIGVECKNMCYITHPKNARFLCS